MKPKPSTKSSPEGEIHNHEDLKANKSVLCDVFGIYEWVDPRKRASSQSESENPPENCQAAIQLEDGILIYLQPTWKPSAVRSKTELLEYHKKPVVVTGVLLAEGPPSPNGSAYIIGPCLIGSISIADLEIWKLMNGGEVKWE